MSASWPRRLGRVIGRSVAVLATLLLALPVLLLPISTAAPAWAWLPLALAGVALLVREARAVSAVRAVAVAAAGMLLLDAVAVIASQGFAATPGIVDDGGAPVPGSIAVLEQVELNGSTQWITIRGRDRTRPILLHLGMGGPGGGGFATRSLFEPLEKDFVVVSWDEPGTGKSYGAVPISELTPERFVDDGVALTRYLCDRFDREKIYVYGVSWTSILGVWLVQRHPELYYAYIGNGQMVNTTENDVLGYELALEHAMERGDAATAQALRRNGPPPYAGDGMLGKYVAYMDVLNEIMGSMRYGVVVPILPFVAPEYGYVDKVNHTRGLVESFAAVYPQLADLDFTRQALQLEVPVYLFAGRQDVNAMSSLVTEWYEQLQAPHKQLIWLEGGHGLGPDNREQFVDAMINAVLPETYPGP